MKKKSIWIIIAAVAVIIIWAIKVNNRMVTMEENVNKAWSNVENVYQRRADLIPNLVNTVKGYAAHETSTFEAVVNARAKATSITVNPENMTADQLKEFQKAQNEVGGALGRLIAVSEAYPELKANENYAKAMDSVNLYENQVRMSRMVYNDTVTKYNKIVRQFPDSVVAGLLKFETKEYLAEPQGKTDMPSMKI